MPLSGLTPAKSFPDWCVLRYRVTTASPDLPVDPDLPPPGNLFANLLLSTDAAAVAGAGAL